MTPGEALGLAVKAYQAGNLSEAERLCREILAEKPNLVGALRLLARTQQTLGRVNEALATYERVLTLRPEDAVVLNSRGGILLKLKQPEDALASYERALALQPNYFEALNNRGAALRELERVDEALASCEQAVALRPDSADAFYNRGVFLSALRRVEEALASYEQAVALRPDFALAHLNRSLTLLLKGNYADGWEEYEWRWKIGAQYIAPRRLDRSQWQGEDLADKKILLYSEQGHGDTIQFLRYAPLVASRGACVILEVPPPLLRLAQQLPCTAQVFASGAAVPGADFICPLGSLPRAFHTTVASIPGEVPYLAADPAQVAAWRQRLVNLGGLCTGLVWAGDPRSQQDRRRSITLAHFATLGDVPGVSFVSLQKGPAAEQTRSPLNLLVHDWTDELDDFADTAALIEALDLVISVDTSVAHLAGALGKPVWLVNRFDACWRWLLDRDDSPWYPTLRQFRQTKSGDWRGVMVNVREALAQLAAGQRGIPQQGRIAASLPSGSD